MFIFSAYGKTLEDLSRHRQVKYVTDSAKLVNNPLFRKQTPLADDMTEVEMAKRIVKWGLPLQIGFFVYQYAKLRMLEFFYDCLVKYVDKADFELCEMDTDSLYLALAGPNLESVIKPSLRKDFYTEFDRWFPSLSCPNHKSDFVETRTNGNVWSPECKECLERKALDKRTPGLMKLEWAGEGCVALTSKTYVCFGGDLDVTEKSCKTASKGLSTNLNNFTKDFYLNVLDTKKPGAGINRGFRAMDNKIVSYEQQRAALPYLYIKRKVGPDGRSTTPLDL